MKTVCLAILIGITLAGCSKNNDVVPGGGSGGGNGNVTNTNTSVDPPVVKLTRDDSIHMTAFAVGPQTVKISTSGKNIILKLNENINMFLAAEGFSKTSAVHLIEDFKGTLLAGFDYTTVAEGGNTTLNWVDDNLNNVKTKTLKDTVINHINFVKINLRRTFTFFRVYNTDQMAIDEQNLLLNKKDDLVMFTSYTYYNQKVYPKTSIVAYLDYER